MQPQQIFSRCNIGLGIAIAVLGLLVYPVCNAEDSHKADAAEKLLQALPASKMSLADGIQ